MWSVATIPDSTDKKVSFHQCQSIVGSQSPSLLPPPPVGFNSQALLTTGFQVSSVGETLWERLGRKGQIEMPRSCPLPNFASGSISRHGQPLPPHCQLPLAAFTVVLAPTGQHHHRAQVTLLALGVVVASCHC